MKKFNILKSIVDFTWINLCLGFFVYTIFVVILLFNYNKEQKLNFEFYGVKIEEIGAYEKLLLVVLLIFIGIIIYVYYQFKTLLRNFGRRKIFTVENIKLLNQMGSQLILSAFFYAIPVFFYQFYIKKITLNFGFSYFFVLLILGLFFKVLSEIFQISKVQKEENELTV